jgi:ADP-heptose:LPS heptosyltransferase
MSLKKIVMNLSAEVLMVSERLLRGRRVTPRPDDANSVLILEYMLPLGCCVHLTPVYEAIKQSRPGTTITVVTRGLGAALLRHNPFIDHLIQTPDPLTDLRGAARSLSRSLVRLNLRPNCCFTGASDQRTRIALLSLFTGAGWRGGFTQSPQLYHRPLSYQPDRSLIDNNLQLLSLLGIPQHHFEPRVFFSAADAASAQSIVRSANPEGRPLLVMVTQNSGGQSTGWHIERFAEVIRHAHDVLGCAIVYAGTASDFSAIEHIRRAAGEIGTSLAGQTSVTELAALLALSDAAVSLDTGTMHVGRAVGTPMVVIGPSWQRPTEWLPLGQPHIHILRGPDHTDIPKGYRLDEVHAAAVIAALEDLLLTNPPSPTSRNTRLQANTSTTDHRSAP